MNIETFFSNNAIYGVPGINQGPLIAFSLKQKTDDSAYALNAKNIFFLFDNSASMYYTLPVVKSSILTFRDLLCQRTSMFQPPVSKEVFDKYMCNFNLYTFSEKVRHVWGPTTKGNFDDIVNCIEPEGCTNMGEAIETAFKNCDTNKANWIIVFTDGESNKGRHQTSSAFHELAKTIPNNTKLLTLGYGKDFNIEILNSIGEFTFLENKESIPTFMGALTHEISTCSVFNAKITGSPLLFGEMPLTSFSSDKIYHIGFSSGQIFDITYTLITENGIQHKKERFDFSNKTPENGDVPENIKKSFYSFESSKMIKNLLLQKDAVDVENTKYNKILEKWTENCAIEFKESVLRFAKVLIQNKAAAVCLSNSLARQTSYVNDIFASPAALSLVQSARDINETY